MAVNYVQSTDPTIVAGLPGTAYQAGSPTTFSYFSATTGNLLVAVVGGKPSSRTTTAPAIFAGTGGNDTGGTGSSGTDSGATNLYFWYRTADGSEPSSDALTWSSSASPAIMTLHEFSKTNVGVWDVAHTFGNDATHGLGSDAINATGGTDPGFTAGDMVVVAYHAPTDSGVFSNPDLTIPGCTVGSMTLRGDYGTNAGNDGGLQVWTAQVTAGASSGAPVFTCDVSDTGDAAEVNATAGPVLFARLREPSGDPDTTPPSVPTGLQVDSVTSSSVTLSWSASTDDVGVAGYKVYQDGVEVDDLSALTTTISGLLAATSYDFTVSAYDAATNESSQSSEVTGVTESIASGDEVTLFTGSSLPVDWTATEPVGSGVDVENGYAALKSNAGSDFDSLSSGITAPQGPRITKAVSGSFDFAVALAASVNTAPDQGIDLLALGAGTDGVRFAQYTNGTPGRSPSWFTFKRESGVGANQSVTTPPNNLYGGWNWMRLTFDDATNTFTCRISHTGKADWHTVSQFTSTVAPTSFVINATAFGPDANGREQRVAAVVDMLERGGDDATITPSDFIRVTVLDADFSGVSLPAGLTADVALGGSVVVSGGYARLTCNTSTVDSRAWIVGPDTLLPNHGLLMRYRFPQPNVQNAFGAPLIRAATATTLPASQVLPDKYRPGTGSLAEINGGGSFGDIVRILHSHPVELTETYNSSAEFDGFEMAIENLDSEVDGTLGNWIWIRIEAIDGTTRAKFWYDGSSEPGTWPYSLTDFTQAAGTGVALAWAHNDSTSGGNASMDVDHFEVYEMRPAEVSSDKLVYDGVNWRNVQIESYNGSGWA